MEALAELLMSLMNAVAAGENRRAREISEMILIYAGAWKNSTYEQGYQEGKRETERNIGDAVAKLLIKSDSVKA